VAHFTARISEGLFARLMVRALSTQPAISFSKPAAGDVVWFGATGRFRVVACGGVEFEDGNTFLLSELDIAWEELKFELGLDIASFEVGGFCVLPIPEILGGGCVRMKRYTMFPGVPDVGPLPIDLSPLLSLIVSEVSGRGRIWIQPSPGAHAVCFRAEALDVDPIDIEATTAQLDQVFDGAKALLVAKLAQALPPGGWLLDFALGQLGFPTLTSVVADMLDIGDDLQEWLMDKLNVSIGLPDLMETLLLNHVLGEVAHIDNPFPVADGKALDAADYGGFATPPPATVTLPEVAIPVERVQAVFSDDLLTVEVDLDLP
jgi:hypothetical protein